MPADRFLRHMSCVALTDPDSSTLTHIFHTILDQYLTKLVFPDAITELSSQIIASTQQIYSNATRSLLPTPAKSHYMFNLRDFARVVHGVMLLRPNMLPKDAVSAPRYYKRLFVHEILRVFYDRLIDDTDRMWLLGEIRKAVAENMDENLEDLFPHLLDPSVAAEWPKKAAKEEKEGEEEEEGTPTGTHTEGQEEGEGEEQPKVVGLEHLRRVFFTDLMDTDEETEKRGYQEVQDVPGKPQTVVLSAS